MELETFRRELIGRTVIDDYPVRIEYTITSYCLSTQEVVAPIERSGKSYQETCRKV